MLRARKKPMDQPTSYDEDFFTWSEQQAAV
jgi:hypothetical protein